MSRIFFTFNFNRIILNNYFQLRNFCGTTEGDLVHSKTFQQWIFEKFRSNNRYVSFPKLESLKQPTNLNEITSYSTEDLISGLHHFKKSGVIKEKILILEDEIINRIPKASFLQLLEIFDSGLLIYGPRFGKSQIFCKGIDRFEKLLSDDKISVYHKLQCIYYASLDKKNKSSERLIKNALKSLSPSIKQMNDEELGIFCSSLFRTSIKADQVSSFYIIGRLKLNLKWFIQNPFIFICLIKSLRHSQSYDDELFETMVDSLDEIKCLKFIPKVHILVYFSDCLYSDTHFVYELLKSAVEDVNKSIQNGEVIRLKDIDNLLWAASNYCTDDIKYVIASSSLPDYIIQMAQDIKTGHQYLFGCLLSLFMLNYSNEKLYQCVTYDNIVKVKKLNEFKEFAKVSLLLTGLSIEIPHLVNERIMLLRDLRIQPKFFKYLSKRPEMKKLLNFVQKNKDKLNMTNISMEFLVPGLFVGGVKATVNDILISIELIDETVCLRYSTVPSGRMQLKIRLLKSMGLNTHVVTSEMLNGDPNQFINNLKFWTKTLRDFDG